MDIIFELYKYDPEKHPPTIIYKAIEEIQSLRQQLATVTKERDDHLKREVMLRDALDIVSKCSVVEDCRLIAVNALAATEPKEQGE